MNRLKRLAGGLVIGLFAAGLLFGQTTLFQVSSSWGSGEVNVKPQAVPTSLTVVTTYDARISGITIVNPTAGAITITLQSRESVPVPLLSGVNIAANTTYVLNMPYGHWMPEGFTVQAGGAGLIYYARWRQ